MLRDQLIKTPDPEERIEAAIKLLKEAKADLEGYNNYNEIEARHFLSKSLEQAQEADKILTRRNKSHE